MKTKEATAFSTETHKNELAFLKKYPFATLISDTEGSFEISKIPLLTKIIDDELFFEGHLARANPHWQTLQDKPATTIMFDGAHGYISPTWYADITKSVPTWNYSTLVANGHITVINDASWIQNSLEELASHFEKDDTWLKSVEPDFYNNLSRGVVGIKAKVLTLQSKFKLSQTRSASDRDTVICNLKPFNVDLANDMTLWNKP